MSGWTGVEYELDGMDEYHQMPDGTWHEAHWTTGGRIPVFSIWTMPTDQEDPAIAALVTRHFARTSVGDHGLVKHYRDLTRHFERAARG